MRLFNKTLGMFLLAAGTMLLVPALPASAQQQSCATDADCTEPDAPFCHSVFNVCLECLVDSQCDDGLFCNGVEECRLDGLCQDGPAPCAGGLACDEKQDTCEVCGKPLDECSCPRDGAGRVLRPGDQTAVIRREKRRKGKVVTTVTGLDPVACDLASILKQFKTTCGTGGTIGDEGIIEVQGDHREKVAAVLNDLEFKTKVI